MHIIDTINNLAATDSPIEKKAILKASQNNSLLSRVFQMTYSKRINFGVTKARIPGNPQHTGIITLEEALNALTNEFATREVSGNAAIDRLSWLCNNLSKQDFDVFRRVIARDLDCGTGVSLANATWKDIIPEQPCFLAAPYSDKNVAKIKFPAFAQLKADGARCMALISGGKVQLMSRAGNEYTGLVDIVNDLLALGVDDVMIDGEIIHKPKRVQAMTNLDALMGEEVEPEDDQESDRNKSNGLANKALKGTITNEEQSEMVFNVWDIVPQVVYWGYEQCALPCTERFAWLQETLTKVPVAHIELIECQIVNNLEEAKLVYRNYVDMGREGIILKNFNGIWVDNRTTDQIKFKEEILVDMKIVGVYPHKKDKNKVGGFTLESADGYIRVNCGSGLKDKQFEKVGKEKVYIPLDQRHEYDRELLWSIKDQLIGKIVEVKCNGLQRRKSRKPHEPEFKLFLPIFQKIRHDKSVANKVTDVFDV